MMNKRSPQSGNIFLVLFAATAAIGILGFTVTNFVKGPMASAVKLTRTNTAMTQMAIAAQTAVVAANSVSNGDCDGDSFIEPLEWRLASSLPAPTGGGLIPSLAVNNTIDPWGNNYGYCVWDDGTTTLNAACQQTTSGTNMRLAGSNSKLYPVVAVISSGPDKTFQTTCRSFATADVNSNGVLGDSGDLDLVGKTAGSDDIIFTYTYEEASTASGGLWTLKSTDATTAKVNKNVEANDATFSGTGTFTAVGVKTSPQDCSSYSSLYYNDPLSNHCYYKSSSTSGWAAAQTSCQANSAYLAVITSSSENTMITSNMSLGGAAYWIGATDSASEGVWTWQGGEQNGIQFWSGNSAGSVVNSLYNNWQSAKPLTDATKNCVTLTTTANTWQDADCATVNRFICEKSPPDAPLQLNSGLRPPTPTQMPNCNASNTGSLRRNVSSTLLEMCDGTSWLPMGSASVIDNLTDGIGNYVKGNLFLGANASGTVIGNETNSGDGYSAGNTALGTGAILTALTSGIGNTAFGTDVLSANVSGNYNTAVGNSVMVTGTNPSANTAAGKSACQAATASASYNVCLGASSLIATSTASTAAGYGALHGNSGNLHNTAAGSNTMYSTTTGTDNTALGLNAMYQNISGNQNTTLGYYGGFSLTGIGATAIGAHALQNAKIPATAIGSYAMYTDSLVAGQQNTAIGFGSLYNENGATANTSIGYQSSYSVVSGSYNTVVGYQAGQGLAAGATSNVMIGVQASKTTTSNSSVGLGSKALYANTGGSTVGIGYQTVYNNTQTGTTGVGYQALNNDTIGANDTAIGFQALFKNTSGNSNTAIGHQTLYQSLTGNHNTAVGYQALTNTTADYNTAVGYKSLLTNTTGTNNAALGYMALKVNVSGSYNTAFGWNTLQANTNDNNTGAGYLSLYTNTAGTNNTGLGAWSLYGNTTGSSNVALGFQAAYNLTTASNVTAVGMQALFTLSAASTNTQSTAFGAQAAYQATDNITGFGYKVLSRNTTGISSVAGGYASADFLTSGDQNITFGAFSMYRASTGIGTTAVGYRTVSLSTNAGSYNTAAGALSLLNTANTGNSNVAFGYNSLPNNNAGSGNVAVGYKAAPAASGITNSISIGANASATATNTVMIGDTNITSITGQVAFAATSDKRVKKDIKPSDLGLEFILGLKPVSYRLIDGNGRLDYGFLAQDIEKDLNGRVTNMVTRLNDQRGTYQLRSADLEAPMVKAIQERQKIIDGLKAQIEELKKPVCADAGGAR